MEIECRLVWRYYEDGHKDVWDTQPSGDTDPNFVYKLR